jgi:membrane dipeptidase
MLVLPLFVPDAHSLTPEEARRRYEDTFATLDHAIRSAEQRGVLLAPGSPVRPGHVATLLSFEGADGFADRPEAIDPWIRRGACFVGLVHARTNALAGSRTEPDPEKRKLGLSDAGRALAERVYQNGGVIDAAHASDAAVDDLVLLATRRSVPLVITHTGLSALRNVERNLDDERVRAVAGTGGVVGIDLHSGHIARAGRARATLADLVAQIRHAIAVAGDAHVAIGSDFDGGIVPPAGADGAAFWPVLAGRLAESGLSADAIAAVYHGNATRVVEWARARGCATEPPQ